MNPPSLDILYEDNHLLVLNKPAGLPTMGTPGGRPTLLTLAKEDVKRRYAKPGNVYLGVVSRLDAPVSGVVLLARTSKAAARLTKQFHSRTVEKSYWAVVEGVLEPPTGRFVDWLAHDDRHRRMHIVGPTLPGAREARLSYRRLGLVAQPPPAGPEFVAQPPPALQIGQHGRGRPCHTTAEARPATWLQIELETGRKHQIRLQFAHHGHPIIGDRKYGSRELFAAGIALHARRLVISHPTTAARLEFEASPPYTWQQFGIPLTPAP
jgi:23S rRNA pseudouridine1911/1915/1917 synthase